LAFTVAGLLVQAAAVGVVLWGESPLWTTLPQKLVVALVVLVAPSSEEIWLNGNGTQYYLAQITACILLNSTPSGCAMRRHIYRGLLLCAGLTGLLSCLLTPLYWLKAITRREREGFIQAGILTVTTVIQFVVVAMTIHETNATRFEFPSVYMFGLIVAEKNFLLPLRTPWAEWFSNYLSGRYGAPGGEVRILGYSLLLAEAVVLGAMAYLLRKRGGYYLVGAFVLLILFPCIFGIGGDNKVAFTLPYVGNRYFYAPNVLIMIGFISVLCAFGNLLPARTIVSVWFVVAVLFVGNGLHRFFLAKEYERDWPVWRQEVAKWRTDSRYVLHVWPPTWWITLDPK